MKIESPNSSSLSIVIPCFNEEGNVRETVQEIEAALFGIVTDYELLVFNDCSTDRTKELVDALAQENKKIRAFHNPENRGLGYNYRMGVKKAQKEYLILVPGDNEVTGDSIREICKHLGKFDLVIPYIQNYQVRPLHRQFFSRLFTIIANGITGFDIKYYNGIVLHKLNNLRAVEMNTDGFAYQVEILVQLLRQKSTYIQVPMVLRPRSYGSSRAFHAKNVMSVIKTLVRIARSN